MVTIEETGIEIHERMEGTVKDYGFCEDCDTFFDLWKYGDIESAGHADCKWRYVTEEEFRELIKECQKDGCFDEVFL